MMLLLNMHDFKSNNYTRDFYLYLNALSSEDGTKMGKEDIH